MIKTTFRIDADLYNEIDKYVEKGNVENKSEFIRKAIVFYLSYLKLNENVDYVAPVIDKVMRNHLDYFGNNMSEMLFKLAVEVSKLNIALSVHEGLTALSDEFINDVSCKIVSENNGILRFEDARKMNWDLEYEDE